MNGQGFTFNGYLPKNDPERSQKLKELSHEILKTGFAQLFIETPYRNQQMLDDIIKVCAPQLKLTVAYDITGAKQKIKTKSIIDWKKAPFKFDKTPCVFVLGSWFLDELMIWLTNLKGHEILASNSRHSSLLTKKYKLV